MATPTIVQSIGPFAATGTSDAQAFPTPVSAGSAIVVLVGQPGSNNRTFSCSDNINGAYSDTLQQANSFRQAFAGYYLNSSGGSMTVTTTSNASNGWLWMAFEVSDADEVDVALNPETSSGLGTHDLFDPAAAFSADSIAFGTSVLNASASMTEPVNWTEAGEDTNVQACYRINATSVASDSGTCTESAGTRDWASIAFALKATGGGGGTTVTLTTSSETNAANAVAISNPRTYTLGTASESGTANAVTVQQAAAVSLGNATETDVANAVSVVNPRSYQLGNATDSSAANALSVVNPRSYSLGNASESDTANAVAITNASTVSLGTAAESCVANSLTVSNPRTYTLTTASEVSIGRAVTVVNPRSYSLGNATESNAANALTVSLPGQTTAGYILVRNATLKTGKATATLRTGHATATLIS